MAPAVDDLCAITGILTLNRVIHRLKYDGSLVERLAWLFICVLL